MIDDYQKDMKKTKEMFERCKNILQDLFKQVPELFINDDLEIVCLENQSNNLEKHLDCKCGIDYLVIDRKADRTVELAWRSETCPLSWYPSEGVYNAFSIREKRSGENSKEHCEMNKRTNAIKLGLAYPKFSAQVIYDPKDNDSILSLAIARTEDIYKAHDNGLYRVCNPKNKDRIVTFHDVSWELMQKHGYSVYDWYRDATCVKTKCMNEYIKI